MGAPEPKSIASSRSAHCKKVLIPVLLLYMVLPSAAYAQYTESFETWTATTADTWETKDLSGAPFNVPANAVVEVAVRNSDDENELWGGVRAVGSSLNRRFQLHEPEGDGAVNGHDVVVMHVQSDAASRIQHDSDVTAEVDFGLLGYLGSETFSPGTRCVKRHSR